MRNFAVVADGSRGLQIIDLTNDANTIISTAATGGDARDIALNGNFGFIAEYATSFKTVALTDPSNPVVSPAVQQNLGGRLNDVAVSGRFAFGADVLFVFGVPIIDVQAPGNPLPRDILDFSNLTIRAGHGIAVDGSYVYYSAVADEYFRENGENGNSSLCIGQYVVLEDLEEQPPTVSVVSPANGEVLIEGATVPIMVDAIDDVAVLAIDFLVDGDLVFTDTSTPYEFNLTVPSGVPNLVLGATATDLANNIGVADTVLVDVIPDPLTTVVGQVTGADGNPLADATVTCLMVSGQSSIDGNFSIQNVPTNRGSILCTATFTAPTEELTGQFVRTAPVGGGITDVGNCSSGGRCLPTRTRSSRDIGVQWGRHRLEWQRSPRFAHWRRIRGDALWPGLAGLLGWSDRPRLERVCESSRPSL